MNRNFLVKYIKSTLIVITGILIDIIRIVWSVYFQPDIFLSAKKCKKTLFSPSNLNKNIFNLQRLNTSLYSFVIAIEIGDVDVSIMEFL